MPSMAAKMMTSARPDWKVRIASSGDLTAIMVEFGAKRRAQVSCNEPRSQATLISGLLMSSQVLGRKSFLAMQPNGWVIIDRVKPIDSALAGVGFSAKPRSILLDCRSSTELPDR